MKASKTIKRREFMAGAGAAALSVTVLRPELVRGTQANSKIRVGLIGCGGLKARAKVGTCWDHFVVYYQYPDKVGVQVSLASEGDSLALLQPAPRRAYLEADGSRHRLLRRRRAQRHPA